MKIIFQFLLYFLFLHSIIFPQNRILETNKSSFKELKSNLIKSERSICKDTLREKLFYKNNMDEKTIINKKLLENGFLLIEVITQAWRESAWFNSSKSSYSYDDNNNLIEFLWQTWHDSVWANFWKDSYTYDQNDNQTEWLSQHWVGSLLSCTKYSSTYDENNNKIEYLIQHWEDSVWVSSLKVLYKYDENNNSIEELVQYKEGTIWVYDDKYSYTYDENNNLTEYLIQTWDGSAWVNDHAVSITYDENNNIIEWLLQFWDGSDWVKEEKNQRTYDENNNLTEYLRQIWEDSVWVNETKGSYKYRSVTKIEEDLSLINSYSLSNNYPNPFNPTTTIIYSIPKKNIVVIKVYDILGREIRILVNEEKPAGSYKLNWNAENLPSGVYFYRITTGNFFETKKMVLLR